MKVKYLLKNVREINKKGLNIQKVPYQIYKYILYFLKNISRCNEMLGNVIQGTCEMHITSFKNSKLNQG